MGRRGDEGVRGRGDEGVGRGGTTIFEGPFQDSSFFFIFLVFFIRFLELVGNIRLAINIFGFYLIGRMRFKIINFSLLIFVRRGYFTGSILAYQARQQGDRVYRTGLFGLIYAKLFLIKHYHGLFVGLLNVIF